MRQGELVFLRAEPEFLRTEPEFYRRLETAEFERAVAEGRGDRIYWNRNEPGAMRRPGEVVS
jgi:hypothetical protein